MEPITILSVVFTGAKTSYELYKKLSNNNIIRTSRAIIDWTNKTINQTWQMSRKKSMLSFVDTIWGKKIQILNVTSAEGYIVPQQNNDLFKLGILSKNNDTLEIHLKKFAEFDDSNTMVVKLIKPFDSQILYAGLTDKYWKRLPKFASPGVSVYVFSVMLDSVYLWKEDFEYVRFTNISLDYDISIDKHLVERALSSALKEKMVSEAIRALKNDQGALRFMNNLNVAIRKLESRELVAEMDEIAYIEVPQAYDVKIHSVKCEVNPFKIAGSYDLLLPALLHVEIRCTIDAKDQAIRGKLLFEEKGLEKFISRTFDDLNSTCL